MRKIKNFRAGDVDVTIEFDPVYQEYAVRQFRNGAENRAVKYHTDNKQAAIGIAKVIFKSFVIGE